MIEQDNKPFSGEEFKQKLIDANLLNEGEVTSCTGAEIQEAMKWQNVKFLPSSYIEYLQFLGHYHYLNPPSKGAFFVGFDWSYSYLKYAKDVVDDMELSAMLPSHYFIFAMELYGDGIYYFKVDEMCDNPPVFYIHLDSSSAKKVADSFTSFLYQRYNSLASKHKQVGLYR